MRSASCLVSRVSSRWGRQLSGRVAVGEAALGGQQGGAARSEGAGCAGVQPVDVVLDARRGGGRHPLDPEGVDGWVGALFAQVDPG